LNSRSTLGKARVAVLVSHPIQYFVPVYRTLSSKNDVDLTVLYHCRVGLDEAFDPGFGARIKWDIDLLGGYRYRFLSERTRVGGLQPRVIKALLELRPDVVIMHGYTLPTNILALLVCKAFRVPVLLRGDSRRRKRASPFSRVVALIKKLILRLFDGFLAIGTLNKQYYSANGIDDIRVFHAPLCVDNAAFQLGVAHATVRRAKRDSLRLNEDHVVILFASKLSPRKRAADVVKAFAAIATSHPLMRLVIAGSGETSSALQKQSEMSGLVDKIRFVGFVNQSELPSFYAMSDLFVFPAENEPWGLVLNEAMAAGLPVIVSDDVGAGTDLVLGRGTGYIYAVGDCSALSAALESLGADREQRRVMAKRAREVVREWDVTACVDGILQAITAVREGSIRRR
jgi:glycosyltransferase involved in cell wall biosynthesis